MTVDAEEAKRVAAGLVRDALRSVPFSAVQEALPGANETELCWVFYLVRNAKVEIGEEKDD